MNGENGTKRSHSGRNVFPRTEKPVLSDAARAHLDPACRILEKAAADARRQIETREILIARLQKEIESIKTVALLPLEMHVNRRRDELAQVSYGWDSV